MCSSDLRLRAMALEPDIFEPWSVPGIEAHPGWWPGLDYTDRPNVVARWAGSGGGRSLILNGHIDVVPAGDRSLWTHDPYGAEVVGSRIYGRGTADQKIGIAAMIMAVACLKAIGIRPAGDVILESVVNEELGGYNGTLACCVKGYTADAAVVVCRVPNTRWPVSAAVSASRIVSRSRNSPTRMMSGSSRRADRRASVKLRVSL